MKASRPPAPPDPMQTAQAQSQANRQTATTQQQLNMVDQSTPYGSLSYEQTGAWDDGTPRFKANTTLAPEEQRNLEQQWQFDNLVNNLGIEQTKRLSGHLDQPIDLSNEATESRLMDLGRRRLDPVMQDRRAALETQLYNQGVRPGTEAWENAQTQFGQQENDAYNELLLRGRGQAVNEALTARNQPINEITALMAGGQVTQPSFGSTPQAGVSGTDVAELTMDAYKMGPLAQWQAKEQQRRAMMSGLFNLGGTVAKAALMPGGWGRAA